MALLKGNEGMGEQTFLWELKDWKAPTYRLSEGLSNLLWPTPAALTRRDPAQQEGHIRGAPKMWPMGYRQRVRIAD